jgi:hypothetical protein
VRRVIIIIIIIIVCLSTFAESMNEIVGDYRALLAALGKGGIESVDRALEDRILLQKEVRNFA